MRTGRQGGTVGGPARPAIAGAAEGRVAGPAIALMITGLLAVVLTIGSLILNLAVIGNARVPAEERGPRMVGMVIGTLLGMAWGAFVATGAWKMKTLESRGLAMAAAIVAMIPCSGCCLLGLPFGIWALVVLADPDVKNAFR